jgi:hypothetical protein
MRFYLKLLITFLKAASISLLFGVSWAVTFYGFDTYASLHVNNYRNDFFLEVINFFFSGLIGALVFFVLIRLFEKLFSSLSPKS